MWAPVLRKVKLDRRPWLTWLSTVAKVVGEKKKTAAAEKNGAAHPAEEAGKTQNTETGEKGAGAAEKAEEPGEHQKQASGAQCGLVGPDERELYELGEEVRLTVVKSKDKYNYQTAKILRLGPKKAKVEMRSGPELGKSVEMGYKSLLKIDKSGAGSFKRFGFETGASASGVKRQRSEEAAVEKVPEDTTPDIFGDLSGY
jgi:hypothetical protein